MSRLSPSAPIMALVYEEGSDADKVMAALAAHLTARGIRLAGFVQHEVARTDRCRCDIILSELASGVSIGISQDRGAHARGCRLDVGELLRAMHLAREAVVTLPIDLVLVNKFGKTECEGGGLRPLIVDALERGRAVLCLSVDGQNTTGATALAGAHVAMELICLWCWGRRK